MNAIERFVDARELAELMGVSTTTVKRWVREGIPSETWGMSRTRRFQPSQAVAWARARAAADRGIVGGSRERAHNAPPGNDDESEE